MPPGSRKRPADVTWAPVAIPKVPRHSQPGQPLPGPQVAYSQETGAQTGYPGVVNGHHYMQPGQLLSQFPPFPTAVPHHEPLPTYGRAVPYVTSQIPGHIQPTQSTTNVNQRGHHIQPARRHPDVDPPKPNDAVIQQLATLAEPERSEQWLRMLYIEDIRGEIPQVQLWSGYTAAFERIVTRHPQYPQLMTPKSFFTNVPTAFDGAGGIENTHSYTVRGIIPRSEPGRLERHRMQPAQPTLNAPPQGRHQQPAPPAPRVLPQENRHGLLARPSHNAISRGQPPSRNPHPPKPNITHSKPAPVNPSKPSACKPTVRHAPHKDSKLCENFHWVPYPLGLLPFDSWNKLHDHSGSPSPFRCPVCRAQRKPSAHTRKIFLVAERLSWDDVGVSIHEKDKNEQLTWEVNYELGILDPCILDADQVPGGKKSQSNRWHPYQNEYEMKQALNLIFVTGNITEASWSLWTGMQKALQKMLEQEEEMPTNSTGRKPLQDASGNHLAVPLARANPKKIDNTPTFGLPSTPSVSSDKGSAFNSSSEFSNYMDEATGLKKRSPAFANYLKEATQSTFAGSRTSSTETNARMAQERLEAMESMKITSYKTLQDFYSLLDQIERTSYVGALFLEAYAEHLHGDKCRDCWFKQYVEPEAE